MQAFIKVRDTLVMLDKGLDEDNWLPIARQAASVIFLVLLGVGFFVLLME